MTSEKLLNWNVKKLYFLYNQTFRTHINGIMIQLQSCLSLHVFLMRTDYLTKIISLPNFRSIFFQASVSNRGTLCNPCNMASDCTFHTDIGNGPMCQENTVFARLPSSLWLLECRQNPLTASSACLLSFHQKCKNILEIPTEQVLVTMVPFHQRPEHWQIIVIDKGPREWKLWLWQRFNC